MNAYARLGAFLLAGIALSTTALAERKYSDWGPAVRLDCGTINSPSNDFGPAISKDGLSLYISSNRPGSTLNAMGVRSNDIWVSRRSSVNDAWPTAVNLGSVNSGEIENNPSFSRDGHWMFFNSDRSGGFGDLDIWASYRAHVHNDFAWETPFNLGLGVNTAGFDAGASFFENEDGRAPLLFFGRGASSATMGTTTDIWVAELLPDGTFGNASPVDELSSPYGDQRPSIRFDGLEIFFFSNRQGSTLNEMHAPSTDIWVATRKSIDDKWDVPVLLTNIGEPVNTAAGEFNPHISADGLTLYFASTRGGCGGFADIYMTTRTHVQGNDKPGRR